MKRFFTLLLVFTAFFSSRLIAQCNAEFTFTVNGATGQVQFTPVNTAAVEHTWLFGDGSSSNIIAPLHAYSPGTYNVVHVVMFRSPNDSSVQCIDSSVRSVTIIGQACNLQADFSFARDSVQTNKVYFTNLSTGVNPNTTTRWTFGDGTSSFDNSPVHIYTASGLYTVCLYVSNGNGCVDSTCNPVQVQVPTNTCNLVVNFADSVINNNTHYFINQTTPLSSSDSVTWYFGDGNVSHDFFGVLHTYANSGTYNVCLVVKKNGNTGGAVCVREYCRQITIAPPTNCNIVPGFVASRDSSTTLPATYQFYNTTTGLTTIDSSFWNFGDGSPVIINPNNPLTHTYTAPGVYVVCLKVKKVQPGTINIICERQICQTIIVDTPQVQCNLQAFFTAQRDSSLLNKFYFTNLTQGLSSTDSIRWTFGDGTNSSVLNPDHVYNAPGTYTVCLRVKKVLVPGAAPCVDDYCQAVLVQQQPACNLVVGFGDSTANNTVYFTNYSTPLAATDSIRWTFGDGSSSTDVNPVHTYNQPGSYTVCLRVKKAQSNTTTPCVREFCRVVTIDQPCNIVVSYTAVLDSAPANPGSNYIFTNTSAGLSSTDSSFWSFGDGTPVVFSPSSTISHVFTRTGTFNVCLIVKKMIPGTTTVACVRESCRTIVVQQTDCNFIADFTYVSDSVNGGTGNAYSFTNTSAPLLTIDSSFWSFGDGSPVVINPGSTVTHTYANPGTYTVCLLVKKVVPGTINILCERSECKTIVVLGQSNPCDQLQVNFEWRRDSANSRLIHFINQTNPVTTNIFFNWSFGDGTGGSTGYNPEHLYTQPGTYTVCLRAQMANCVKDTCKTIVIQPSINDSCTIRPSFVTRLDSANRRKVHFTNTTLPAASAGNAVWSFGDGTSSTSWNAVHEYAMPGLYAVCLTVTQGNICTRTICDSVFVPGNVIPPVNCDSFRLEFGYRRDDYMPNKLFFFASGNAPVYNQQWTFTPANGGTTVTLNQNNPVYVFPDTGLYRVCVRGAFSTNCVKEYCNDVRIFSTNTPTQCMLTAYPNPAHNIVFFNVQLGAAGIISSTVFNSQGIPVMQYTQTGVTGNNLVALGIQNLVPGFYTVRIMYNGRVCYTRFQKI